MSKPQPKAQLTIVQRNDGRQYTFVVFVASSTGSIEWLEREAPAFGRLDKCLERGRYHFTIESCLYDVGEVLDYLGSMGVDSDWGNVVRVVGRTKPRTIGEMNKGDVGYAMPVAYDRESNFLDEHYRIVDTPNTIDTMLVRCLGLRSYKIQF